MDIAFLFVGDLSGVAHMNDKAVNVKCFFENLEIQDKLDDRKMRNLL